ncbi:MAG: PEGA domain-containing protein [Deferribacteres bacterium]|nr:PEGA domain-containing protein [Deferribacteres bacterium]
MGKNVRKIVLAILVLLNAGSGMLLAGCVFVTRTAAPVYYANTITIHLKTSPPGAAVMLDGVKMGVTPLNLKVTYLDSRTGVHESETQKRLLRIEKQGYEPYVMVFSVRDEKYREIPELIRLKPEPEKPAPSIQEPAYSAETITIRLNSSPPGARVFLDGRQWGNTPLDVRITYLRSDGKPHESETRYRILKIEKQGYKPYVLVFSIRDKSYREIPELIRLKPEITGHDNKSPSYP